MKSLNYHIVYMHVLIKVLIMKNRGIVLHLKFALKLQLPLNTTFCTSTNTLRTLLLAGTKFSEISNLPNFC